MAKHENSGDCRHCDELFNKYPGFYDPLRKWFKTLQKTHPTAHISCAGRNEADQMACLNAGTSRAAWRRSAHNWNAAVDIFGIVDGVALFVRDWYDKNLVGNIPLEFEWYGSPNSPFPELPHVQLRDWQAQAMDGDLKLVNDLSKIITH